MALGTSSSSAGCWRTVGSDASSAESRSYTASISEIESHEHSLYGDASLLAQDYSAFVSFFTQLILPTSCVQRVLRRSASMEKRSSRFFDSVPPLKMPRFISKARMKKSKSWDPASSRPKPQTLLDRVSRFVRRRSPSEQQNLAAKGGAGSSIEAALDEMPSGPVTSMSHQILSRIDEEMLTDLKKTVAAVPSEPAIDELKETLPHDVDLFDEDVTTTDSDKKRSSTPPVDEHTQGKRAKRDKHGGQKERRVNYFVAARVFDPEIVSRVNIVHNTILEHAPALKSALIPLNKLHITLLVIRLEADEIQRAVIALHQSRDKIAQLWSQNGDAYQMALRGIGHFQHHVLFARVDDGSVPFIVQLADVVRETFEDHGFELPSKDSFKPHITIAKMSKARSLKKKGIHRIKSDWYQKHVDDDFGKQLVSSVQLCSMVKPARSDGYYYCESESSLLSSINQLNSSSEAELARLLVQAVLNDSLAILQQNSTTMSSSATEGATEEEEDVPITGPLSMRALRDTSKEIVDYVLLKARKSMTSSSGGDSDGSISNLPPEEEDDDDQCESPRPPRKHRLVSFGTIQSIDVDDLDASYRSRRSDDGGGGGGEVDEEGEEEGRCSDDGDQEVDEQKQHIYQEFSKVIVDLVLANVKEQLRQTLNCSPN